RAQYDRSEYANRRSAQAIPIAGQRIAKPARGIAENESRTAGQGQAPSRAERGSRTQEHRSRTGPPGAGRESRTIGADFEIQIRVSGEHVARVAHAAEQPADPCRSVGA